MSNEIIVLDMEKVEEIGLSATKEKYEAIESDLNEIQQNLTNASDKISIKLDTIVDFAEAAQHPNMYNALAKVLSSFAQLNKEAAAIIKQKQELYDSFRVKKINETSKDSTPSITNIDNRSVTFEGTSTDILDKILTKRDNKDEST